jgi:hypothetical protein
MTDVAPPPPAHEPLTDREKVSEDGKFYWNGNTWLPRIFISGHSRRDPRYEQLAADWRARGFHVEIQHPHARKEDNGWEALQDVLIWLGTNIPQDLLALLVADVYRRLRKKGVDKAPEVRTLTVEICGGQDQRTLLRFKVEEDEEDDDDRDRDSSRTDGDR